MQVTRETDRVEVKNGHEQLEKGSEMKNIKFSAEMCEGLYSKRRDQVPGHTMKSNRLQSTSMGESFHLCSSFCSKAQV